MRQGRRRLLSIGRLLECRPDGNPRQPLLRGRPQRAPASPAWSRPCWSWRSHIWPFRCHTPPGRHAARNKHGREYWFIDARTLSRHGRSRRVLRMGRGAWQPVRNVAPWRSKTGFKRGEDVVLEIDWQGALQIKQLFPHAVLIFILPPSWNELQQRLQRRGEDGPHRHQHSAWPTRGWKWPRPSTSTSL